MRSSRMGILQGFSRSPNTTVDIVFGLVHWHNVPVNSSSHCVCVLFRRGRDFRNESCVFSKCQTGRVRSILLVRGVKNDKKFFVFNAQGRRGYYERLLLSRFRILLRKVAPPGPVRPTSDVPKRIPHVCAFAIAHY